MIDSKGRHLIEKPISLISKFMIKNNISANTITIIGLLISITGSLLYYLEIINYTLLGFLWVCGLLDVIDGKVANLTKKTKLGTFLDIVIDRIVEFIFIFAIATRIEDYFYFFILFGVFYISISVFLTSGIISNDSTTNKSFHYSTGITERTETFIFISALIIIPSYYKAIIILFIILVIVTIIQRTLEVIKYYGSEYEKSN